MERAVMVALVIGAWGCTGVEPMDAGADLGIGDAAVMDAGLDNGPGDAGDPQCADEDDFTPCDDGRGFTIDACIGGVCVGRACTSIDRQCMEPRLTLDSCEGVPINEGEDCDDGDDFTIDDVCTSGVCGGYPCECPPDYPCCFGDCTFRPSDVVCDEWVEIDCEPTQGCGQSYRERVHEVHCSGDSVACEGAETVTDSSSIECSDVQYCRDGQYIGTADDEVGVTIGCTPDSGC